MADDLPVLAFGSLDEWETWLERHGSSSHGVWLKFAKAGASKPTLEKKQAIEGALSYGWIDGQIAKFDDHYFLTRFTPRRARSKWSAINRETAKRLIKAKRMKPAGIKEIERAKADGRWDDAYQPASRAKPAADLAAALKENHAAQQMFDTLDGANRYAIIYRVEDAKRPDTRARRIAQFVDMLARGETLHPPRKKKA